MPVIGLQRRVFPDLLGAAFLHGVVTLATTVHNQKGELVLTGEQKILLRKRDGAVSDAR